VSPTFGVGCGDGGVCLGDGGCLPVVWPYQPSNFQPSPGPPGPIVTFPTGCSITFNSTNNTWQQWQNQCPGVSPPPGTVITMPGGSQAVLISMWSLTVESGALVSVVGDKPVIFAAFGDIHIRGQVRANTSVTNSNGVTGAGANPTLCAQMTGGNSTTLTAGGGGGAFGGPGASGGGVGAGAGGIPGSPATEPLRGGCRGGNGGGLSGGLGGSGGGAVQFSAGGRLEVGSLVTASGSGAKGGNSGASTGGGGGGSGGMILLEGDTVDLTSAILTSNGGGGGSGEGNGAGKSGEDGSATSDVPAPGGAGSATGGAGGSGGTGTAAPNPGATATAGSGGGGAGVGVIIVRANQNSPGSCIRQPALTSPPPVYLNCP
jgi:hypothetical protein